jgi:hypothetical protein
MRVVLASSANLTDRRLALTVLCIGRKVTEAWESYASSPGEGRVDQPDIPEYNLCSHAISAREQCGDPLFESQNLEQEANLWDSRGQNLDQ